MSRFSNLEFSDENEFRFGEEPVSKDERFYFIEATEFFHNGRFDEALRSFSRVLEFNPDNAAAWTGQVRMLIELGEFHEARLWADKALERFQHEPELLAAKAVALARMGDFKAAIAFSDASIEERGDTPYIWLARGDVLLSGKEKRAEYCFEKALAMGRADWFLAWLAARIHAFYSKFSLALRYAQQALNMDPGRGVVWLQLGRCQFALGLVSLAEASFEQAREIDPACPGLERAINDLSRIGFLDRFWFRCRNLFRS
jgi:tetratricopeptide (TPR) repeat protein